MQDISENEGVISCDSENRIVVTGDQCWMICFSLVLGSPLENCMEDGTAELLFAGSTELIHVFL